MSKKLKSILAFSAAVVMLFTTTACGKNEEKDEKKSSDKPSALSVERDFDFDGVDSAVSYAENAMNTINDAMEGNLEASASTEIYLSFGDMATSELGYDFEEIKISNDAKVKGEMVANDLSLIYDDKTAVTLNMVIDGEDVYVRIPELNDAYIKANVADLGETYSMETNASVNAMAMTASPEFATSEIPEEMMTALEKFDEEKIEELVDTYAKIVKDNMPEGKDSDKVSGKIHDLSYKYDTKVYDITGENAYDMVLDFLNEVKNDAEIAELFESVTKAAKEEAESSGYFTDDEIEEMYPTFDNMISDAITNWEAEKEDAYDSDSIAQLILYYDDEECMGIEMEVDGEKLVLSMIDETEEFGFTVFTESSDEEYGENSNFSFTIEGSEGKYDGKFSVTNEYAWDEEYNSYAEIGFNSDVEVVDEESGAFKGEIEFYMSADGETASLVLTSDSTAKMTDLTFEALYNDESIMTIGLTNVTTNATDITIPSGKIYDFANEADVEEYSANCDMEAFEQHIKDVLGDELFSMMVNGATYEDLARFNADDAFSAVYDYVNDAYDYGNPVPDKDYYVTLDMAKDLYELDFDSDSVETILASYILDYIGYDDGSSYLISVTAGGQLGYVECTLSDGETTGTVNGAISIY